MSTVLFYAPALEHTRAHHPENHQRLQNIVRELAGRGVLDDVRQVGGQPASEEQLLRAHEAFGAASKYGVAMGTIA